MAQLNQAAAAAGTAAEGTALAQGGQPLEQLKQTQPPKVDTETLCRLVDLREVLLARTMAWQWDQVRRHPHGPHNQERGAQDRW
ncbi:hypothetical protein NDU88_007047 [Pleurodeles waltl]|uniref:Uncharacterized protein n=1 Tax=Pleurodeles waltl TaxID=8319 RepID=A0AAV7WFR1_PLEWA|nr:hypothetical protein NDU88_007047 [Pleurodeles waltl]